jgi:hypothetical protein
MLTVATLLWDANTKSQSFSRCYDETWVERLYRGFKRNLTEPFQFVCFVDHVREMPGYIRQVLMTTDKPDYGNCIEPYKLNQPMILAGLDTVITGNIDHLARYCMEADTIALPRDPFKPSQACNGVALVPAGNEKVYRDWRGENDMEWMRSFPHVFVDDLFAGQIVSYKGHVKKRGLGDARIVYFHGKEKPHELNLPWIKDHWLGTKPRTALVIGGAKCVWADIEAATDIGEFQGVVACNDAGVYWRGHLDAWVTLHPEKMHQWIAERAENGLPPARMTVTYDTLSKRIAFTPDRLVPYLLPGQQSSGSSGLFAVKVALQDLGFDKAVCCGIPMTAKQAHFFKPADWHGAKRHQAGWVEAHRYLAGRVTSMSGWTVDLLGKPTEEWFHEKPPA